MVTFKGLKAKLPLYYKHTYEKRVVLAFRMGGTLCHCSR